MSNRIVIRIADWLISHGEINEEDRDLYQYALKNLLHAILPISLSLIVGLLFHCPERTLIIILPFVCLRRFGGGFHLRNAWVCMFFSAILITDCLAISFLIRNQEKVLVCALFAGISMICLSPVQHLNKQLTKEERKRCKRQVSFLVLFFSLLLALFYSMGLKDETVCLSIGMMLPATLQYPVLIERLVR